MRKLCEEKGVLFAVLWIVAYCLVIGTIKGSYGYDSPLMLTALFAFAAGICVFVKKNHLEKKYGLAGWPKDTKRFLYFIPLWILSTGNLWGGVQLKFHGAGLVCAVLSMALVGFVEEMIFRGFLFKGMLAEGKPVPAVIVSSLTFGIGHIVNFLTGQAGFETAVQIVFAVSLGFVFTMVCYKSGSLIPCIIAHSLIDVFSLFAGDNAAADRIYVGATIVVSMIYCIYLCKAEKDEQ